MNTRIRRWLSVTVIHGLTAIAAAAAMAGLTVEKVWPEKLLYTPGEPALLTVTLKNTGSTPARGRLVVDLRSGFDGQRELFSGDVEAQPTEKREIPMRFTADGARWGWEARARLLDGEKVVSEGRDCFVVNDDPWRVAHYSGYMWSYGIDVGYIVNGVARQPYCCVLEHFGQGQAYVGKFIPDRDEWVTNGGYRESKATIRRLVQELHRQGIRTTAYVFGTDFGPDGYEFARQHPDWVRRRPSGDWMADYNVELLDKTEDDAFPYRTRPEADRLIAKGEFPNFWYPIDWDWQNLGLVRHHASELVQAMKEIGYDGFRYDFYIASPPCPDMSGKTPKDAMTLDECGVRNYDVVMKTVRQAFPKALFGQNYGVRFEGTSFATKEQKAWRAICPGNYMLFEETVALWQPDHVFYNWDYYRKTLKEQSRHVLDNGGYYFIHLCRAGVIKTPLAYEYQAATAFASRAHLGAISEVAGSAYEGVGVSRVNAFALRFADQIFDPALRDLAKPDGTVTVTGGDLWWQEYRYTHPWQGREVWVLHLINPPPANRPDPAMKETRPPAKGVTVRLSSAENKQPAKAWYLTPDQPEWITPLPVKDNAVTVSEVRVWGVVCVEW